MYVRESYFEMHDKMRQVLRMERNIIVTGTHRKVILCVVPAVSQSKAGEICHMRNWHKARIDIYTWSSGRFLFESLSSPSAACVTSKGNPDAIRLIDSGREQSHSYQCSAIVFHLLDRRTFTSFKRWVLVCCICHCGDMRT